jgi:IS5 family transposase
MAYQLQRQTSLHEFVWHQSLQPDHELLRLAATIDWDAMTDRLRIYYKVRGRGAKPVRLMVGLMVLKHRYNLSDETVVAQLHENVYWQAFCGVDWPIRTTASGTIVPTVLVEASSLTKFRQRIGIDGTADVEKIVRDQLIGDKVLSPKTAIIDTTAQEKHVAYPLDTHLLHRGREQLIRLMKHAQGLGVGLPKSLRSFSRKSRQVILGLGKLGRDRMERIEHGTNVLAGYCRHVVKRVPGVLRALTRRAQAETAATAAARLRRVHTRLREMAGQVKRVMTQATDRFRGIHHAPKLYSLHEPQVVCIRKGKRSKPDEYGSKVLLAVDRRGYVVGHQEIAGNPADATLLEPALKQWEQATGRLPHEVAGDRGMTPARDDPPPVLAQIAKVALPSRGKQKQPEEAAAWFKRLLKKRVIIEPIISHLKSDHRMNRCRYKGFLGDQLNVAWAVMAWNTKQWMADTA